MHRIPIHVASLMRPEGESGVRTHMRSLAKAVDIGRAAQPQAWPPLEIVSPFNAPIRTGMLIGVRALLEKLWPSLAVRWYRTGHGWALSNVLEKRLADGHACTVYAQCPVSAAAALTARVDRATQRVVMAVHFNVSQADEWADTGRIPYAGRDFYDIRAFEAQWLPQLDALVFVSAFMRGVLLERLPMLARVPHAIVPNFVADPGSPAPLAERGQPDGFDADLLSIGTLEPRKHQAAQIRIIAAARDAGLPLTLTIVGEGPDKTRLQALVDELKVGALVNFAGYVGDAARLLPRHRALLHTARMENLPIAPIEALAAGRPVCAVLAGGTGEVFDDKVEGLALPADDPISAAIRVSALLSDRHALQAMGAAARTRYLMHHTSECVARRLIDLLEQV